MASAFGAVRSRHAPRIPPHLHCAQRNTTNYNSMTIAALEWRHDDFGFGGRDLPGRPPGAGDVRLPPQLAGLALLPKSPPAAPPPRAVRRAAGGHRAAAALQRDVRGRAAARRRGRHPLPARSLPDPGARRLAPTRPQEICKRKVAELRARFPDLDIEYIHRVDRSGFKAGALENGLRTAKGEFVLIFDADFLPLADILERTIHHFSDPQRGGGAVPLGARQP